MVLDTIINDEFIFKNTDENEKQVKLNVADPSAPDEFYFVHIEKKLKPPVWNLFT